MPEMQENGSCLEDDVLYPDGHEYCLDVYCFKCTNGEWKMSPSIGALMDPSEVW
jgi:hypothetical protein